jgi:parallel beta-helix repeat protein
VYYENLFIDETINLEGENKNTTFIDGEGNNHAVVLFDVNNVKISGFTIQNTGGSIFSGLVILYASDNEVFNNIFKNNYFGVNLKNISSNNIIYNNIFIENTYNAVDFTKCTNQWDNGYPSGGNFWNDHTGDDYFSGPYQNITGSDGIIDEPYIVQGSDNCQDRYPLVELSFVPNSPPDTPSSPNPSNHATNIPIDTILSWTCTDPDGDPLTYDVYFGINPNPPKVSNKQSGTTYDPGPLDYSIQYFWRIVAWDDHASSKSGPSWDFITGGNETNSPPNTPSSPNPSNHATNIPINTILSWTCTDPNGDPLTYDVYFGTNPNPPKVSNKQSGTTYDPGSLDFSTSYYWKVVAWDDHDTSTTSSIWDFTTGIDETNNPPNTPSNPNPSNNATNIPVDTILSWTCTDPDGNPLTYDVYFGTNPDPPKYSSNQTGTTYDPVTINYNTKYYWKVVAWDSHDASTISPIWDFNTMVNNPPYPPRNPNPSNHDTLVDINADLSWLGGDPDSGDTVTYDVYFGTSTTPPIVSNNQTSTTYDLDTMNYNTKYYWKIVAWDNKDVKTVGSTWDFTTSNEPNDPPNTPSNPDPINNAIGININTDLSWTGGDSDTGDTVTYDIYFGTNSNPSLIQTNHDSTTYNPDILDPNTKYYWKIVAKDNHGAATTGPIWYFTTIFVNYPPNTPYNPTPQNGKTSININQDLYWDGGDPNSNDTVTYDIYFGTTTTPEKIISNQSATSYSPDKMDYNTKYYWKIVAWDNHGESSIGPIWSFTTGTKPSGDGGGNGGPIIPRNKSPTANASASDHSGLVNTAVTFDGSYSIDEDGEITNYTWDFGDDNMGYGTYL